MRVPPSVFGPGSRHSFAEYLEGESSVRVQSVDDIGRGCRPASTSPTWSSFTSGTSGSIQAAFERRRRGDCEDFALWAWRKLAEVGVDAEF
jgi:hypothetical protein